MEETQALQRIESPQAVQQIGQQSLTSNLDAAGRRAAVEDLKNKVLLVQEVMKAVMQPGEHYGTIPGCGEKPTLLKPGAEKLGMTFRLRPTFLVDERQLERGHREYRVTCTLSDGTQGVGTCSTMETKYRYRAGERKCPTCGKATIIKGKAEYGGGWLCYQKKGGCGAKFEDGDTSIESQSTDRVEYPDPADYYNTCLKIGKKRAHVDSIITATACSDIFTQDIEDMDAVLTSSPKAPPTTHNAPATSAAAPKAKQATQAPKAGPGGEQTYPTVTVKRVTEKKGTNQSTGKPWTVYFITFHDGFGDMEAGTFDSKIADVANEMANIDAQGKLVTKPGRKAGTFEIVSLTPAQGQSENPPADDDRLPMEFDENGRALEVTP